MHSFIAYFAHRIAFDGDSVTSTWISDEEINLRVIMDSNNRTLAKLSNTKIYTASGLQVPLNRLAKVETIQTARQLQHCNLKSPPVFDLILVVKLKKPMKHSVVLPWPSLLQC